MKIDFSELLDTARDAVVKEALSDADGPAKLEAVVDRLIVWLDDEIHPPSPIAEAVSDFALRGVLRPVLAGLVQHVYDEAKKAGGL